jgi:hypothetical protein
MIERTLVMAMIEAAAHINKDGLVATVCADASALIEFYEGELERQKLLRPKARAHPDVDYLMRTPGVTP